MTPQVDGQHEPVRPGAVAQVLPTPAVTGDAVDRQQGRPGGIAVTLGVEDGHGRVVDGRISLTDIARLVSL